MYSLKPPQETVKFLQLRQTSSMYSVCKTRFFYSLWSLYRHFVVLSWQARCSDVILQESTEEFMFYG